MGHAGNGYPDAPVELDESTRVELPWRGIESVIGDLVDANGDPFGASPRGMVHHLVGRFARTGLVPVLGFEYEAWVFEAAGDGARRACPGRLAPPGAVAAVMSEFARRTSSIGHPLDTVRCDGGAGYVEFSISPAPALRAADGAARARQCLTELCAEHGLVASFMAKPYGDREGAGGHVHASLERNGVNVFADQDGLTAVGACFVAGLVDSLPELTLMFNPHVNSFKRIDPQQWVPTRASWGYDDRRTACRVVTSPQALARVEHRRGGADANPYVSGAAVLAGGIWGIERGARLPPPRSSDRRTVPASLAEAIAEFEESLLIDDLLPRRFAEVFTATRRSELARYEAWLSTHITEFEFQRHLSFR
ncbi:MAG: glutamine synthetase family protein [Propionibacteriales bacterium]|nr:glutamine synthetase family protein [Propionibacteriales bacterium]